MENAAPLFAIAAIFLSMGALIHVMVSGVLRWRAMGRPKPADTELAQLMTEVRERLDGMERALEVQGVEIERISEAQRFTTRLLTERTPGTAAPLSPPRGTPKPIITPH